MARDVTSTRLVLHQLRLKVCLATFQATAVLLVGLSQRRVNFFRGNADPEQEAVRNWPHTPVVVIISRRIPFFSTVPWDVVERPPVSATELLSVSIQCIYVCTMEPQLHKIFCSKYANRNFWRIPCPIRLLLLFYEVHTI